MNFATFYKHDKLKVHKFVDKSVTDKTAYTPLSVIISRAESAGQLRSGILRGIYDYKDGQYVDIAKVDTCPYYEPDLVEGQTIAEAYRAEYEKRLADRAKSVETAKTETVKTETAETVKTAEV